VVLPGGSEVRRSEALVGCRFAFMHRNTLYVSPALYDLLTHEEGAALRRLLEIIRIVPLGGDQPVDDERLREARAAMEAMTASPPPCVRPEP
jgi:hypothetical protein